LLQEAAGLGLCAQECLDPGAQLRLSLASLVQVVGLFLGSPAFQGFTEELSQLASRTCHEKTPFGKQPCLQCSIYRLAAPPPSRIFSQPSADSSPCRRASKSQERAKAQ